MTPATREAWLVAAMERLRPLFLAHGSTVPDAIRVSCGWPSSRALSAKKQRIGECWHQEADAASGHFNLFISPVLDGPVRVLDVLVHELVHAAVGPGHGHRAPFSRLAKAVGLVKPWTATTASPALTERLNALVVDLGPYPHGALTGRSRQKKQGTRMLKAECAECGYTVRVTQKWLDEADAPLCPTHGVAMDTGGD